MKWVWLKNIQRKKREKKLKTHLESDNRRLLQLFENKWVKKNFRLDKIHKRYVLKGDFKEKVIIIKFKKGDLRIGQPIEFCSDESYFDIILDFSSIENTKPEPFGTEHFLYFAFFEDETEIEKKVQRAIEIIDSHRSISKSRLRALTHFEMYRMKVTKLNEPFI